MKPESSPVTPDEYLLRCVDRDKFPKGGLGIASSAFAPRTPGPKVRDPDTTRIRLYRESCLAAPEDILATADE